MLLKFNRLKAISDDPEVIVAALRKSNSGLMDIEDNGICNVTFYFYGLFR